RRAALSLVLVVVSYYLGFIDVILYNYDRFLLPVCAIQALFAGVLFDRWIGSAAADVRSWRMAGVAGVFAYGVLYVSTIDVLMLRDSRYFVEQWLRSHVGRDESIGTMFPLRNLPRIQTDQSVEIKTVDALRHLAPEYYVLNVDYARAVPPNTEDGALIAALQQQKSGYTLALRYRAPAPWPWLPGAHRDLVGPRLETEVVSTLRDINPTFEVYRRAAR